MKHHLYFSTLIAGALLIGGGLRAQDAAEDRDRDLNKRLTDLGESIVSLQKRVNELRDENGKLRDEIDRLKNKNESAATQEAIKKLQDGINEVEKNRKADYDRTLKALKELEKSILERSSRPSVSSGAPSVGDGDKPLRIPPKENRSGTKEVGWEYGIQDKDTLSGLITKLRAQDKDNSKNLKNLTQKQVMDANPGVNWNKLKIGQKIFIPAPQ